MSKKGIVRLGLGLIDYTGLVLSLIAEILRRRGLRTSTVVRTGCNRIELSSFLANIGTRNTPVFG